ncbi:MAG: hypothetical protein QM791_08360 [Ferruginibacter sp.]
MITYTKKNRFFKIHISWFGYKFKLWDIFSFNSCFHIKNYGSVKIPGIRQDSHTIEIDLEQDEETLFNNVSKQIRQQYRISETEGIKTHFSKDIDTFVDFFNDFAKKRGTFTTSRERLLELGDSLELCFAQKDDQVLVAHTYLVDKEAGIVRHHHSATTRLDENIDKNLIGRANKYMLVKNILHYKSQGFKIFDMGGYAANTTDEGLQGINRFKMMFGGKVVPCINFYSYNYWLFKKLSAKLGMSAEV